MSLRHRYEWRDFRCHLWPVRQEDITAADGSVIPADGLLEIVSVNEERSGHLCYHLPFGSFYLKELSTDSHYLLNGETFRSPLTRRAVRCCGGDCRKRGEAITNELIRGEIHGLKTDENGAGLGGAVIGLFKSDETEFTAKTPLPPPPLRMTAASPSPMCRMEIGC